MFCLDRADERNWHALDTVSHTKHNSSESTNMTGKGKNCLNFNDLHGKALPLEDRKNT